MEKARLKVRVNPRSSRNQITDFNDGMLAMKLTAPPVEGAANKAATEYLAEILDVKKSQVKLISGQTNREKVFEIEGLSEEELNRRLRNAQAGLR